MLVNSVEKTLSDFLLFSPGPWVDNTEGGVLKANSIQSFFIFRFVSRFVVEYSPQNGYIVR
jgi:hypothetical protein